VHRVGFYQNISRALFIKVVVERELSPSSKVIDAFPRPPSYRAAERKPGRVNVAQLTLRSSWGTWKMLILMTPLSFYDGLSRIVVRLPAIGCQPPWMKLPYHASTASQLQDLVLALMQELPTKENRSNCLDRTHCCATCRSRANQKSILSAQTTPCVEWTYCYRQCHA